MFDQFSRNKNTVVLLNRNNDESNVNSKIIPTPTHTHSEIPAVKVSDPLDEVSRQGEASASSVTQQRRGIAT